MIKKIIKYFLVFLIITISLVFIINGYVIFKISNKIITENTAKDIEDVDCIIVLGAGIWDNKPTPMLEDRLLQGISLYNNGVSKKIIMSGDHGRKEYDEVNVMKEYAIQKGVISTDIFMDHARFFNI